MFYNQNRKLSISEITEMIKGTLESSFANVQVEGEISNWRPASSGHCYFSLKDKNALLSAVMFRGKAGRLGFLPSDGQLVTARGSISVYAQRGSYQLIVDSMELAGEGNILAMLEERKRRLAAEGLFNRERKKPLPLVPQRVAIVTSPTGAALKDIMRVLRRRHSGLNLVVLPALVQGKEAAPTIAKQIKTANDHQLADVLIVGRGGGSLEDLLPFSEEIVVRAVAESRIPVISAVGHEIDSGLSDLAADLCAPTPSAAAEVVTANRMEIEERVLSAKSQMEDSLHQRIDRIRLLLEQFSPREMERSFRLLMHPVLQRLDDAKEGMLQGVKDRITNQRHRLELLTKELETVSPLAIMDRGFALVTEKNSGKIIRSVSTVTPKDHVHIRFAEGSAEAEIQEIKE